MAKFADINFSIEGTCRHFGLCPVLRRLQELVKDGYVERVGNAYRVTDKVNIPDLQKKLQRRIDLVTDTAKKLSELSGSSAVAVS